MCGRGRVNMWSLLILASCIPECECRGGGKYIIRYEHGCYYCLLFIVVVAGRGGGGVAAPVVWLYPFTFIFMFTYI